MKLEIERGSSKSYSVENSLWKGVWTCLKTGCGMNELWQAKEIGEGSIVEMISMKMQNALGSEHILEPSLQHETHMDWPWIDGLPSVKETTQ